MLQLIIQKHTAHPQMKKVDNLLSKTNSRNPKGALLQCQPADKINNQNLDFLEKPKLPYCPANQEWQWHHALLTQLSGTSNW